MDNWIRFLIAADVMVLVLLFVVRVTILADRLNPKS